MAHTLRRTLIAKRGEDSKFPRLWQKIIEAAQSLSIEPTKKRTVRRQQNRSNPPVNDIEAHYRVAYYYAFLDHTINHLNTRFPETFEDALIATHLLPANIGNLSSQNISKIRDEFEDVLPQPSELQNEVTTWKVHKGELDLSDDDKKSLLFTCTFAANNNMYYPNIYTSRICYVINSMSKPCNFSTPSMSLKPMLNQYCHEYVKKTCIE